MSRPVALGGTRWRTAALVADPDGLLLDLRAAHRAAWGWWAAHHGLDPALVRAAAPGRPTVAVVAELLPGCDPAEQGALVDDRFLALLRATSRPRGVVGLLRALPPGRVALVSCLTRPVLDAVARRARVRLPAVVATADDGHLPRPDAAAHRWAAEQLGVDPHRTTWVETSTPGVAAARSLGGTVVELHPDPAHRDHAGADLRIHHPGMLQVQPHADGLELRLSREHRPL